MLHMLCKKWNTHRFWYLRELLEPTSCRSRWTTVFPYSIILLTLVCLTHMLITWAGGIKTELGLETFWPPKCSNSMVSLQWPLFFFSTEAWTSSQTRTSHLLGRLSSTWATLPVLFLIGILEIRSHELFAWTGLKSRSSDHCLLSSCDYRRELPNSYIVNARKIVPQLFMIWNGTQSSIHTEVAKQDMHATHPVCPRHQARCVRQQRTDLVRPWLACPVFCIPSALIQPLKKKENLSFVDTMEGPAGHDAKWSKPAQKDKSQIIAFMWESNKSVSSVF
jgi:hypothetical protein